MRRRSILVAGKTRGQIAVILDRRGVVALEQVHVAAGKQRVGQPRAVGKPRFHLGDDALLIGGIVAVAGQFHQQIEAARAVFVVGVWQRLHLAGVSRFSFNSQAASATAKPSRVAASNPGSRAKAWNCSAASA